MYIVMVDGPIYRGISPKDKPITRSAVSRFRCVL